MFVRRLMSIAVPVSLLSSFAGCSSAPAPKPMAFVNATLVAGGGASAAQCTAAGTNPVSIGTAVSGTGGPVVAADGQTQKGSAVINVSCQVQSTGSGFHLGLHAVTGDPNGVGPGSSISIDGTASSSTTQPSQNLHVTIEDTSGTGWTSNNCTLTYTYNGGALPIQPPFIASGRVFGHVSCPTMTTDNDEMVSVGGTEMAVQCDGETDFEFENCSD